MHEKLLKDPDRTLNVFRVLWTRPCLLFGAAPRAAPGAAGTGAY